MKGPAIFLAQFIGDEAPYNSLDGLCTWAANHGYEAIQIPTLDPRLIDLALAAESKTYCDELSGKIREHGLVISDIKGMSDSSSGNQLVNILWISPKTGSIIHKFLC